MRKLAYALIASAALIALHVAAVDLWRANHFAPFHRVSEVIGCPLGYICPVSFEAMRLAVVSPTIPNLKVFLPGLAAIGVLAVSALSRKRRSSHLS